MPELAYIAIGIILGLCVTAALVQRETRRANFLRDQLHACEPKR